jgi:hypothetical protein
MAEKRVIELEVSSNLGNLKQQLKAAQVEVQTLAEKFGATSAQAVEAAKKAAILKDKIGDAKALTDAFNPDAKFKALSGSLTGVAGGFSVVTGAMGAFGKQSEDVEKALLKVQSAMAIASGAQAIGESIDSFKQLGAVVTNFGTSAVSSFKAMSAANKAFMVTGIGVLLVALGAVVAYWEDISNALYKNTRARELNNKVQSSSVQLISKELNAADVLTKQLKSETFTREEKRKKVAAFQKEYPSILSNINAEKTSLQDINTALSKNIGLLKLQAQAKAIQALREESYTELVKKQMELTTGAAKKDFTLFGADFGGVAYGEDATNGILSFVDANEGAAISTKIATKELEKNISALDKMDNALQKQMIALEKQGAVIKPSGEKEKIIKDNNKVEADLAQEKADRIKLINDNLINYYDAVEEERQSKITNAQEKEKQELANKYEALYELADKAGQSTKDLQEQQGKDSQAITKKYNDLEKVAKDEKDKLEKERVAKEKIYLEELTLTESQLKLAKLTSQYEAEKLLYKDNKEILKALDVKYAKDKEVLENEELAKKRERTRKGIDMAMSALSILNDAFQMSAGKSEKDQRKAFKAQKAFNLASALTNTFLAVTGALTAGGNPIKLATGMQFVEAGIAAATGAVQIAKIAGTQFDSGGSSAGGNSGGGATAPTMSAPQFNVVGQSGVNQLASLNQQPIQAYVVSGQVTSQQALDRNRLENATLGG